MSEGTAKKQAVTGFKVVSYNSKKTKEDVKFRIVLEASVDDIGLGSCNMGDLQKALLSHQDSETSIGLNVFVE